MYDELTAALNFIISHLYNKLPRRRVDVFREELESGFHRRFQGHWYPEEPSKGSAFRSVKLAGDQVDPVVDAAARSSGLDITEIKSYLPTGLTLWIDPNEVSYRVGEHGQVQVLFRRLSSVTPSSTVVGNGHMNVDPEYIFSSAVSLSSPSSSNIDGDHNLRPPSSASGGWFSVVPSAPGCYDTQSTAAIGSSSSVGMRGFGAGVRPADLSPGGSGTWPHSVCGGSGGSSPHQPLTSPATFTAATFAQTKFGSTKMKTHGPVRPSKLSPTAALVGTGHDGGMSAVTRLSPTGNTSAVNAAGRWNLSPTAAVVGCLPQSPLGSTAGRVSPMHQATAAASANSSMAHQLHHANGAASPGIDPRIEGLNDWLLLQQRAQRRDAAQLQQVQSYLRVAAVQQQQQHLQQARAAIMAASAFGPTFSSQSSSTPMISDQGSPLPFGFQTGHQQQMKYHPGLHHQQQHFQRQTQPSSGKIAPQAVFPDVGMMSTGNDLSSSSGAMDTMTSYTSGSSSMLNLAEVDWSFDVGSLVADGPGGAESQTSTSGYGSGQGLQHLLLAN